MNQLEVSNGRDAQVDDLLESSWSVRGRPIRGTELRLELGVTALFLVAAAAIFALAPAGLHFEAVAFAVVVAYAIAFQAEFPVGAGHAVPTQLFLVPMFALCSAQLVPGLVFLALALSTVLAWATGRGRLDRLVTCGGDAMHALGPALVIVVFAAGNGLDASAWVIALAFAAQLGFDFFSSLVRDQAVVRVRPDLHTKVLEQVWSVDLALLPFGLLAAAAAQSVPWVALAPLPLVILLAAIAADRSRRIDTAQHRLEELEHERGRHQTAIDRIGDALASRLDLSALLETVTKVATDALDGAAGRGKAQGSFAEAPGAAAVVDESADCANVLEVAENRALSSSQNTEAENGGMFAVSSPIGGPPEPIGTISVARSRPFSNEERALLTRLCQQAAVSASEALRHEQLRAAEAGLRHQAFHDPLTGLPNRSRFVARLEEGLREDSEEVAVLFIDLDGFKLVNDTLGHEAGDELLVVVARRLSACLRAGDTAARLGGDEFAALLHGLKPGERAAGVAQRLLTSLSQPISAHGHEFVVHASVGLAFSTPGVEPEDLLRDADLAMYSAKRDGGHRVTVFANEMLDHANSRIELVQDMPDALAQSDFELRFQPIIDLADGGVDAIEALVRWRHPSRGLLKPDAFIASAEQMGMIDEIGRWVLDQSCHLIANELPVGAGKPRVTVNVSPIQLRDPQFSADVIACVERHGIAPNRLMLEVTESIAIEENPRTHNNLKALHDFGVQLALDDFGAGYSSLNYLAQLPIDILKLDRSLAAAIDSDPSQERLVAGVVGLANSLGLPVVVEGIERASQLEQVLNLRAEFGQGFVLAEPMDQEALIDWLVAHRSKAGDATPASSNGHTEPIWRNPLLAVLQPRTA